MKIRFVGVAIALASAPFVSAAPRPQITEEPDSLGHVSAQILESVSLPGTGDLQVLAFSGRDDAITSYRVTVNQESVDFLLSSGSVRAFGLTFTPKCAGPCDGTNLLGTRISGFGQTTDLSATNPDEAQLRTARDLLARAVAPTRGEQIRQALQAFKTAHEARTAKTPRPEGWFGCAWAIVSLAADWTGFVVACSPLDAGLGCAFALGYAVVDSAVQVEAISNNC